MKDTVLILLFILFASGCDSKSSPEYLLSEYQLRIARVTDKKLPAENPLDFPNLPELNDRIFPLPDVRMNAIDALGLLQCPELSQLVAWRNSSLGKQVLPSQRVFYEMKLVHALTHCVRALSKDEKQKDLQQQLASILQKKQDVLPEARWNAIFADTELPKQLRSSGRLLRNTEDNGHQGTMAAINFLAVYMEQAQLPATANSTEMELHLQQLLASHYSGELLYSVIQLTETLNNVALLLSGLENICPNGIKVTGERLNNVFHLFYIEGIQPYLAYIVKSGREWQTQLRTLLARLPKPPTRKMEDYLYRIGAIQGRPSIWDDLDLAVENHTKQWQIILSQCGLMPGVADAGQ